jgi:hypothetical protein
MKGRNDMRKKTIIKILTIIMALSLFSGLIGSASASDASTNASDYLSIYSATVVAESNGRIAVWFDVNATRVMDLVGASNIVIQTNNGGVWTGVATYFGSSANGMLAPNTYSHTGYITYQGSSGKQYRALVTVYASNSSGSDSRTITTNTVTA